ncbi:MAG: S41 family peptidase, partial [Bacteroidota bacterium]
LQSLLNNRNKLDSHYYIGASPGIGNPDFKNEAAYKNMPYPDAGFRYLAAIRFWNMIHYYFPYRLEMDVDWNTALSENIPAFLDAKNEFEYERAAIKMIGQIKDTHANLWGGNNAVQEQRGKFFPPFRATFVEGELTVVDYYEPDAKTTAPLVGDVITYVNGKSVEEYIKENEPYFPASNQAARLRDIGETMLRSTDSVATFTIRRDGRSLPINIKLYPRKDITGYYRWYRRTKDPSYKMLKDSIGYLTLANVTNEDYAAAKKRFQNAKGIIIDIRNYPSAFGPFAFGGFLIDEPTPFVKFSNMAPNNPGYFTMTEPITIMPDPAPFTGKVVVLINELSQSQAEYTTMAFRAGKNVTVIGSTTAGADGNVSPIPLPGGMRTMLSGLGVFYPDGGKTQRVGIVPDIELRPTQAGIKAGRDELLERAISEILREKK